MLIPPAAPSSTQNAEDQAIFESLASQRPNKQLLPLDTALLHNPSLAASFYAYNKVLHTGTLLPPALLSLAICRVAVLCSSSYSWNTHSVIALRRGLSPVRLRHVLDGTADSELNQSSGLDEVDVAVLAYTDEVTRTCKASPATVQRLKVFLSDREILELTVAVGEYNSVSRILLALEVGLDVEENRKWNSVEESVSKV